MTDDLPANLEGPDQSNPGATPDDALAERTALSPLPFDGLVAPKPLPSSPPEPARWLAFGGILIGGLLGGLIGYGTADLLTGSDIWSAIGGLIGGVGGAVGVGIVSSLTLQAMNEWRAISHPEASPEATGNSEPRRSSEDST